MSIQSEINRINGEVSTQTDLIGQITTALTNVVLSSSGSSLDTTDATATADEIFEGETAYVNGSKVTGTFTIDSELTEMESKIAELSTILDSKAAGSGGASVETCTVSVTFNASATVYYTTIDSDNIIQSTFLAATASTTDIICICGSCVTAIWDANSSVAGITTNNAEAMNQQTCGVGIKITAKNGETATISIDSSNGAIEPEK